MSIKTIRIFTISIFRTFNIYSGRFLFYVTYKNIKMIAFNSFKYLSRFCGTSSALENAFMLSNNRKFIRFQKTYVSMNVLQIHGNKTISNVIVLRMGSIEN